MEESDDLIGGGLIRSAGGWLAVKALRKAKRFQKSDERVLGDGEFVEKVLSLADEKMERRWGLKAEGVDVEAILKRVSALTGVSPEMIVTGDRDRRIVTARSLICYWATEELGLTHPEIAEKLRVTQAAVSISAKRGRVIAMEKKVKFTKCYIFMSVPKISQNTGRNGGAVVGRFNVRGFSRLPQSRTAPAAAPWRRRGSGPWPVKWP
ncbi:MAG: helix-turn-helix domain-containing protein [Desulfosarcina sp.]